MLRPFKNNRGTKITALAKWVVICVPQCPFAASTQDHLFFVLFKHFLTYLYVHACTHVRYVYLDTSACVFNSCRNLRPLTVTHEQGVLCSPGSVFGRAPHEAHLWHTHQLCATKRSGARKTHPPPCFQLCAECWPICLPMGLTRKMGKAGSAAGARVLIPGSMEATETWLGTGKTEKQNFQLDRPSPSNNFGLSLALPEAA